MRRRLTMSEADYRGLAQVAGSLEFFAPFKGQDLEPLLSHIQLYEFSRGERIFEPGSPASALFIIHEGRVRITLEQERFWLFRKRVNLDSGSLFGEMALLEGRAHSAHAAAAQQSKLFVLLEPDFRALLKRSPAFSEHVSSLSASRKFENRF